ncbi:small conductance mechanosensitive channel [Gracilibacillus ureilyticus]|uniref:Small conductance mechanosensitive channel n=1 Tax=Gracilibacillus ureilyticus TaxID=531814 RepID=A0A1H9TLB7_9BACI|nr:mechanosensitive ion channel family protein [Gracilibacillus ureilyticus]SER97898.1 small conductance mechanosensitive channel [Gracilibacillus ureilyticus]
MFSFDLDYLLQQSLEIGVKLIVLIIAFLIISPLGKKAISRLIQRSTSHKNVPQPRAVTLEKLLINIFSYTLIFVFIVMFFAIIGLEIGPLIASAGVVGLAIAFGAQGLVSDIVTGFFILLEKQVDVGDYVTVAGYDGIVEEIGLRTTQIRGFDGTLHFVPNREISGVSNHSRGNMRALVDIGISYEDNIDQAIQVLKDVCTEFENDERFTEGPDVLGVQSFGSSEVVLRVIGKTENMAQWGAERDIRKRIKEAFDANSIEIPYPHQVNVTKEN